MQVKDELTVLTAPVACSLFVCAAGCHKNTTVVPLTGLGHLVCRTTAKQPLIGYIKCRSLGTFNLVVLAWLLPLKP